MKIIDGKDLAGMKFIQQEDGTLKIYNGKSKFIPKENEIYYYIDGGAIYFTCYDSRYNQDQWRIKHQRIFRTEADAVDYLLFLEQLDKYTYNFTSEEWKNGEIPKYYLYFNFITNSVWTGINITAASHGKYPCAYYFKSNEDAHNFISEVGKDRIKKYLFDIWED